MEEYKIRPAHWYFATDTERGQRKTKELLDGASKMETVQRAAEAGLINLGE
jgi:hypothetical protein